MIRKRKRHGSQFVLVHKDSGEILKDCHGRPRQFPTLYAAGRWIYDHYRYAWAGRWYVPRRFRKGKVID